MGEEKGWFDYYNLTIQGLRWVGISVKGPFVKILKVPCLLTLFISAITVNKLSDALKRPGEVVTNSASTCIVREAGSWKHHDSKKYLCLLFPSSDMITKEIIASSWDSPPALQDLPLGCHLLRKNLQRESRSILGLGYITGGVMRKKKWLSALLPVPSMTPTIFENWYPEVFEAASITWGA